MRRRFFTSAVAASAVQFVMPARAQAAWPSRPIRLVVPFPPGGMIDNMARLIASRLGQELGQPVVVDNKPGAGGNVGAAEVARAAADGHTLLMASPPLAIAPAVYASLPYAPSDLIAIALLGQVPNVLLVHPDSGIASVAELRALAAERPGQLNYASNGNGTSLHLSAELFKAGTGTSFVQIPYRGAAAAVTGLMGREVDMMFDNLPSAIGQIQGGRLSALAVTTPYRSAALPEIPTMAEAGVPDFHVSSWFGFAGPAGLPAPVLSRLESLLARIAAEPEVITAMARQGADPASMNSREFQAFIDAETVRWKKVAADANIRID